MLVDRSSSLRPRNWWQAGLLWGTAMFVYYATRSAFAGVLTPGRLGSEFLVWEAGGFAFGILLTALMSVVFRKNLFLGFGRERDEG